MRIVIQKVGLVLPINKRAKRRISLLAFFTNTRQVPVNITSCLFILFRCVYVEIQKPYLNVANSRIWGTVDFIIFNYIVLGDIKKLNCSGPCAQDFCSAYVTFCLFSCSSFSFQILRGESLYVMEKYFIVIKLFA